MAYKDYPKMMIHPAFQPAVIGREFGQGSPIKFPPVTVNSPDQEEEYAAKGYRQAGRSDPQAFADAMAGPRSDYVPVEYPKMLTPPDGGPQVIARDEDEELALLEKWERAKVPPPPPAGDLEYASWVVPQVERKGRKAA